MHTLLVVTRQPSLATAIQTVLDPVKYQLITKEAVGEAEFLLTRARIDAAILDVELTDARAIRAIEELQSFAPSCPILVYTGEKQWEWEEDAYMLGVAQVLAKPVRGKLLTTLLDRLFPGAAAKQDPWRAVVVRHRGDPYCGPVPTWTRCAPSKRCAAFPACSRTASIPRAC